MTDRTSTAAHELSAPCAAADSNRRKMLKRKSKVKGLEIQNFHKVIVYVLLYYHVVEKNAAAEMSHECAYRRPETEASEDAVLFCRIRKISSLDHLLTNISSTQNEDIFSIHVQCSEILFFESSLSPVKFNASSRYANLQNLRTLVIEKCKLRQIPARAFESFRDLKRLHVITHNSEWSAMTMEIHEHAFTGLNELIELDLSDNNIWSTKVETFCSLYSLKTLNLTRNHLQNIKTIGFSDTKRGENLSVKSCNLVLETLDLSFNDLIVVNDYSLTKLKSLYNLLLQNNGISTLEDHSLAGLGHLQMLNVSSNFLDTIPPNLFSDIKYIKEIYLSNNTLSMLPPGLLGGLEYLQILDLSHNRLSSQWINKGTFEGLLRMVILNLSYNRLTKIERYIFSDLNSLQKLNLENNELSFIEVHAFEYLRNLHSLTLSNNKLHTINKHIFSDLFVLHELFIDNNNIRKIDDSSFDNMTNIEDLSLNANYLTSIPSAVGKLTSLKSLDIGTNNITHIYRENFYGLSDLFGLRMVDNKVAFLSEDTFEHLPQLQVLNIASNNIRHIAPGCFRTNENLKLLRMDGNEINNIDGIFNTLKTLVWLNISDNNINFFDFKSFPTTLEWLDLHKNNIENFVNDDMYSHLNVKLLDLSFNNISKLTVTSIPKSVQKLYLHNNNLNYVQVGTFSKLKQISTVTLNNNQLTQLDMNSLRLDQIDEENDLPDFFLSGNPFFCDCSMEWIQRINYLSHNRQYPRVLDLDKTFCHLVHSRAKEKKIIIDMSPSDFLCPYESHCFALCHCCDFVACDCEMICPNNCRCYHDITWNANVVDCSKAGYDKVPKRIPMDATEIYLDGNDIHNLSNHVFIGKKKLQVLYLNNTKLMEVNNQTFKGVDALRVLHLENNKLVELKGDEFVHLNNLKELYLDHNAITQVANNTFSSLKSLTVLKIDDNRLVNFFPWKLLASSTKSFVHVSIEGNRYSCDCKSITELDSWLRKDPGDPEKMLCTDEHGTSTKITIASVISHCKEYLGSVNDPAISKNELISNSIFLPDSYFAMFCGVTIIMILIFLIGGIFYAFRYEVGGWLYKKYQFPLFKESSCTDINHITEGNPNHMYDYYVICNTKDIDFVNTNIMSELALRKMINKTDSNNECTLNILTLDSFSKSTKLSKRLLIVLTTNFLCNDLRDINFKNMFYSYLKSLNRSELNKAIFLKLVGQNQINDELGFILDKFKNISWNDPRFWETFVSLLNCTDTIITVKTADSKMFKKSLRHSPTLRYTTMPISSDSCAKQNFSNSLQYCKARDDGESSQNETSPSSDNNTYGDVDNPNNSYMSIDNRTCPRFNYDLRLNPSSGHVYSRVEDNSPTNLPRSIAGSACSASRTYFV